MTRIALLRATVQDDTACRGFGESFVKKANEF